MDVTEHIISIGANCANAQYLRKVGLRKFAFPFDWTYTPIQSAISLIENDFEDFLDEKNLVITPERVQDLFEEKPNGNIIVTRATGTPGLCLRYGMLFLHDFPTGSDYPAVVAKYNKRIQRLQDVLTNGSKITFLACDAQAKPQDNELYTSVGQKFNSHFATDWKNDLKTVISHKYPDLVYNIYSLDEYRYLDKANNL